MAEPRKATTRDVVDMFLGGIRDFWRGLSNAPNPYANQTVLGIPVFKGHTITGKSLDEAVRDLKSTDDVPPSPRPLSPTPLRTETPAKVEPDAATLALGSQLQLPKTGTNQDLVKMYSAQRSAGQYNMPEIQRMYMEQGRPDLAKWAAANPDLAQREYMKSIQKMGARPEGEELIEAYGGGEPKEGEEIIDAVNFLKKKAGL